METIQRNNERNNMEMFSKAKYSAFPEKNRFSDKRYHILEKNITYN